MPEVIDDKTEHCIPFVLERIKIHRQQHEGKGEKIPPFFLGLNGVQGAGKTTLVCDVDLCSYFQAIYPMNMGEKKNQLPDFVPRQLPV